MVGTQVPLSGTETVLIGLVVLVMVIAPVTWGVVQHGHVMAHEGMHWVVGSLSRTVHWIDLKSSAEGATLVLPTSGTGFVVAAFAGYLGPSAAGLGAARFIQFGHVIAVLGVAMLLLGLLLVKLKPSFGFLTVPVAGILIFLVLRDMPRTAEMLTSYTITWYLLLSGVRIVLQHGVRASDAGVLKAHTSIPRLVWFALWLAGTLAAVVIGARWMLHPAIHPPTR
jgi:hypothetical protein